MEAQTEWVEERMVNKEVETVTASDSFKISHKERGDKNKQWLERSREGFCFLK